MNIVNVYFLPALNKPFFHTYFQRGFLVIIYLNAIINILVKTNKNIQIIKRKCPTSSVNDAPKILPHSVFCSTGGYVFTH